jgi:hypothetical protein
MTEVVTTHGQWQRGIRVADIRRHGAMATMAAPAITTALTMRFAVFMKPPWVKKRCKKYRARRFQCSSRASKIRHARLSVTFTYTFI